MSEPQDVPHGAWAAVGSAITVAIGALAYAVRTLVGRNGNGQKEPPKVRLDEQTMELLRRIDFNSQLMGDVCRMRDPVTNAPPWVCSAKPLVERLDDHIARLERKGNQ